MDYIDKYVNRLKRIGSDSGEAFTNNTMNFIDSTFHASPTYRIMDIDSSQYPELETMDGRVVEIERLGSLREIVLRPKKSLEIGMYAKIDGEWYLLIDKHGGTGTTGVKMLAIKTNEYLRWRDEEQFKNWMDNKDDDFHSIRCVSSATDLGSKSRQSKNEIEWNKHDVRLPVGNLFVSVEKNEHTEKIDLNDRFIFGRNAYEVIGIDDITLVDDEGYGIIQMTVKISTRKELDDFNNSVAYNERFLPDDNINEDDESNHSGDSDDGRLW